MKILAICGSPRKGNSYSALNSIKENFPDIDLQLLMLNDMHFEMCRGCYACVTRGEGKCPIDDDRDMIIEEITDADGIVFATPVYSHMVSAVTKNFMERFGFLAHRPVYFDKYAMSIATCSGYGAEEALKYMDKMLSIFGFNLAPPLELQFRPGGMPEENKIANENKTIEAFKALIAKIEKGERDKPSLGMMIPFEIFKYVSEIGKDVMTADYEYYKNKSGYFYNAKIPFYKKMITKKVVGKIINDFD